MDQFRVISAIENICVLHKKMDYSYYDFPPEKEDLEVFYDDVEAIKPYEDFGLGFGQNEGERKVQKILHAH